MNWGRSRYGGKFHAMIGHETLCGVSVHVVTTAAPEFENRCGNCDKEWRERGRKLAPPAPPAPPPGPADYVPRHRFEAFQ